MVKGEPFDKMPKDLYIHPNALKVFLETFEGPLDILIYLIKRQNINILDIPIFDITCQYMEYVELMRELNLELASEYLVMAAMLAEIKSRMLLPRSDESNQNEEDPRAELIRRLLEYERFKEAAGNIEQLPQLGRDTFTTSIDTSECEAIIQQPDLDLKELLAAFVDVLNRSQMFSHHHIKKEVLSVRERMSNILSNLKDRQFMEFHQLFDYQEGRAGVVVTFLAILELIKMSLIEVVQQQPYQNIHIKVVSS